jgi:hypothetical protein
MRSSKAIASSPESVKPRDGYGIDVLLARCIVKCLHTLFDAYRQLYIEQRASRY